MIAGLLVTGPLNCFACWRLSSSVTLPAGGRSGGRHFTAGQSCYIPLGRHLVISAMSCSYMSEINYISEKTGRFAYRPKIDISERMSCVLIKQFC